MCRPVGCDFMLMLFLSLLISARAGAEKIRTAVPGLNLNYLSIFSADMKGFFKDEGLDNETIVIGGPAGIAALISGDVDYSGAGGSGPTSCPPDGSAPASRSPSPGMKSWPCPRLKLIGGE